MENKKIKYIRLQAFAIPYDKTVGDKTYRNFAVYVVTQPNTRYQKKHLVKCVKDIDQKELNKALYFDDLQVADKTSD